MAKRKSMYEVGDIVETQTTNGLVKGVVEKKLYAELNPPVWIYTIKGKLADGTPYMANSVREEDIISIKNQTNMSIKDKKGAYEFKNSNLRFHGMKMDINGNPCFVLSTPNQRAFSVQQPYSITIHWSTKNGNSKESGIEIVEKNTKGNPFKSEEEFESYVLDLAKDRKHVKVYGNNFSIDSIINDVELKDESGFPFVKEYMIFHGDIIVATREYSKTANTFEFRKDIFEWDFDDNVLTGFSKNEKFGNRDYESLDFWKHDDEDVLMYSKIKDGQNVSNFEVSASIHRGKVKIEQRGVEIKDKAMIEKYKNKLLEYKEIFDKTTMNDIENMLKRNGYKKKNEIDFSMNKGNNFACGKGNFSAKDGERKFAWYKLKKQDKTAFTEYDVVCLEKQKNHRGETYYVGMNVLVDNNGRFIFGEHFEVERPSDLALAHHAKKVQTDDNMLEIEEWLSKTQFSIIEDTKDVLKAGGKLAGNVVKDTLYNGGILMF